MFKKLFDPGYKELVRCTKLADKVLALEDEYRNLTDEALKHKTVEFKERYKNLGKNLYQFMLKYGYTSNPAPKVILNNSEQESDVLCYTGYFDPNRDAIVLFTRGRLVKDVLRTLAHELIHYKQRVDGVIDKSGYTSDKITEDKNLTRLEAEAYLKGNFAFREWTETLQKRLGK